MSEIQHISSMQHRDTPDLQNHPTGELEGRQVENLQKKMHSLEKLIKQPSLSILNKIERVIKEIKTDLLNLKTTINFDQEYKKFAEKIINHINAFSEKISNESHLPSKKIEKIKQDIESIVRDLNLSVGLSENVSFNREEVKGESLFDNYLEALKEVCESPHLEDKVKPYKDADAYNEYFKALDDAILLS